MQILKTLPALHAAKEKLGKVAFVPTMGNLHEGHLALIKQAQSLADETIVSIFVNRLQFGANEDFDRYPRTFDEDYAKLERLNVAVVFVPDEVTLYPTTQTYGVALPTVAEDLCGKFRPGHFRGMATVVLKLFNSVQPDIAIFGKKDYQQLHIIREMVRQFNLPLEIIAAETARAEDGLALSSRNQYLSEAERQQASDLYQQLRQISTQLKLGNNDFAQLEQQASQTLQNDGWQVDYVAIREKDSLQAPTDEQQPLVVLAAARLGKTRLIDNLEV